MTRIFLLSVYGLTTLSALMLTIAEEFPIPTVFTVVLAPLAYVFNERRHRIRLNARTAGSLGAVAIGLTLFELFVVPLFLDAGASTERRVLAGAHLLGYLTWISLFQSKEPRQYWWLVALGLMQVAVGAILSSTPFFGVLFFVYFFLGLWTLSVFSLYQAEQSFLVVGRSSAGLVAEQTSGSGLIAQLVHHQADEFRNSIQLDANQQWVSRRFVAGIVSISVFSLLVGMAFFLLTPRIRMPQSAIYDDPDNMPIHTVTGFRNDVQLGQIGEILESNAKAFEVRFFAASIADVKEYDVEEVALECGYDEPTFRGSVMGIYENGHWSQLPESGRWKELLTPGERDRANDVRQEYVLADASAKTLFCMQPVHGVITRPGDGMIGSDMVTAMLVRGSNGVGQRSSYVVLSAKRVSTEPRPRIRLNRDDESRILRGELLPVFRTPPTGMPQLTRLARQIRDGVLGDDDVAIARAIESHLRDSGLYTYSLKANINDPTIDPVEDFLFNRKQGHCEYFASAMALMLRSQDIPSRLVSGYKGGEKNKYSGAFVVEQRHAHAWVEAFVNNTWYTFDPTPASRGDMVRQIGNQRSGLQALRETLVGLWSQNIVRLSLEQQVAEIYQPLLKAFATALREGLSQLGWPGTVLADFLTDPRRWFSTTTFAVTFLGLICVLALRFLWRRYGPDHPSFRSWLMSLLAEFRNQLLDRASGRHVDFYDHFIRVLRRHGHTRARSQTPLEFALLIQVKLAPTLAAAGLGSFPSQLVQQFYGVRFGDSLPTDDEQTLLRSQLASFEAVLKK